MESECIPGEKSVKMGFQMTFYIFRLKTVFRMKNMIPTGPDQPFRCLEEATHVGVLRHCSRALHLRDLISRKVNQAGRGIFAYLISKYFCRAFQLILVIERASSLPQLLSPAAN